MARIRDYDHLGLQRPGKSSPVLILTMSRNTLIQPRPTVGKYINPMLDYGFKVIFKESGKKQLLIRPLNEIFDLSIVDIDIRESEQMGLIRGAHRASYDLLCRSENGSRFIIEVQLANQEHFNERALFYTAIPIAKSMPKPVPDPKSRKKRKRVRRQRTHWDYDYPPVFFMGLMNFDIRHLNPTMSNPDEYIHFFSLRHEKTGELMTDRLRFAFLEVVRFDKSHDDCKTFEDRFLYMMKNLPTFAAEPELWDEDPYFRELIQEAEFANMTERQQERYLAKMKVQWDNENVLEYARKEAMREGRAEGRAEEALVVARRMLAKGIDVADIAECTGLSEEQIKAL